MSDIGNGLGNGLVLNYNAKNKFDLMKLETTKKNLLQDFARG